VRLVLRLFFMFCACTVRVRSFELVFSQCAFEFASFYRVLFLYTILLFLFGWKSPGALFLQTIVGLPKVVCFE